VGDLVVSARGIIHLPGDYLAGRASIGEWIDLFLDPGLLAGHRQPDCLWWGRQIYPALGKPTAVRLGLVGAGAGFCAIGIIYCPASLALPDHWIVMAALVNWLGGSVPLLLNLFIPG
jgi:hypothetical protein